MGGRIDLIDPTRDGRWDMFVERRPDGWIYHLSEWHRAVQRGFSHVHGMCVVQFDERNNLITAGLPLFTVTSWLTGKRMVSAPFCTLMTPLADNDEQVRELLTFAQRTCDNRRYSRLEVRSMRSYSGMLPAGFSEICRYKHHAIDLSQPVEAIFKKLDRSCVRQRISRAEANNLTITTGHSIEDLRDFFRLYMMTRRRVGRPVQPFRFFQAIWDVCHDRGLCELLFACKDGKRLAGLLLLKYKSRVSAEWAASDDAHKKISPNHFLFWSAIKAAKEQGYSLFDFGRTSSTNKGLMDFKNRWGATVSDMVELLYPAHACERAGDDDASFPKRAASQLCRTVPTLIQESLGSMLYNHLG